MAVLLVGGCASTAPGGRAQLAAPTSISSMYSAIDLRLHMATLNSIAAPCVGIQCGIDRGFERQVARIGQRLSKVAYEQHPALQERVPEFKFSVADKSDGGSASDASGNIIIYRGVRSTRLDEEALGYLIAFEMGRVIARHHDERSANSFLASLVAKLLLTPINMAPGIALLVSSFASSFGADAMTADNGQAHLHEADAIALGLLVRMGWSLDDVRDSLGDYSSRLETETWARSVKNAVARIDAHRHDTLLSASGGKTVAL